MMRRLLTWFARFFPERVIWGRGGTSKYLSRFYLVNGPRDIRWTDTGNVPEGVEFPPGASLMLHRFHRSDDDGELHNHPWKWSVSLILAGGYSEERRKVVKDDLFGSVYLGHQVIRRTMKPWRPWVPWRGINIIRGDDFHRVDLLERDCWSLFLAGPKTQSWGFWCRETGVFTPWREFLAGKQ
jgi:hypothetical protein